MKDVVELSALLSTLDGGVPRRLQVFGLLGLGMVESLASGTLSAAGAINIFFNVPNCTYVRKKLRDEIADEFMSRGLQLHDLFDALSEPQAQQEFQRELAAMRELCLRLVDVPRAVA